MGLPVHGSIETTQIYTHVRQKPGLGVKSPPGAVAPPATVTPPD